MQVGGCARFFAEPKTEHELVEALEFARREKLPFFILGKGSNVIFPDEGFPGLVITLIQFEKNRILFSDDEPVVTSSGGVFLYRLILACRDRGLAGGEFLANIPGTVGGAVVMNAGFSRYPGQTSEIGDLIEEITVLDYDGKRRTLSSVEAGFGYRRSSLKDTIVIEARFRLWRRHRDEIEKEIRANFDYRNRKQDLSLPSSGSVFKNPEKAPPAGLLIESLGLKGTNVGGIRVSEKHGNYFVNTGGGTATDFLALMEMIQEKVAHARGITLEPEVRIIGRS